MNMVAVPSVYEVQSAINCNLSKQTDPQRVIDVSRAVNVTVDAYEATVEEVRKTLQEASFVRNGRTFYVSLAHRVLLGVASEPVAMNYNSQWMGEQYPLAKWESLNKGVARKTARIRRALVQAQAQQHLVVGVKLLVAEVDRLGVERNADPYNKDKQALFQANLETLRQRLY